MFRPANMQIAAHRHYVDGAALLEKKRFDNAGYHFGLSAECAVKFIFEREYGRFEPQEDDSPSPYYKHFPALRQLLLLRVSGRNSKRLLDLLNDLTFMNFWEIRMRYSTNGAVTEAWAQRWQEQANRAIGAMI